MNSSVFRVSSDTSQTKSSRYGIVSGYATRLQLVAFWATTTHCTPHVHVTRVCALYDISLSRYSTCTVEQLYVQHSPLRSATRFARVYVRSAGHGVKCASVWLWRGRGLAGRSIAGARQNYLHICEYSYQFYAIYGKMYLHSYTYMSAWFYA